MSPHWFLSIEHPADLLAVQAVIEKAKQFQEQRDKNLAVRIGNEIAERMK